MIGKKAWIFGTVGIISAVLLIAAIGLILFPGLVPGSSVECYDKRPAPARDIASTSLMCRLYYTRFGHYPYDAAGGDNALLKALHELYDQDPGMFEYHRNALCGIDSAGKEYVKYLYLNTEAIEILPDDSLILIEKPFLGPERQLFVASIEGRVYVVHDRFNAANLLGHTAGELQNALKIFPVNRPNCRASTSDAADVVQ